MNRIDNKFNQLKDKKALITFITAGDPNLETTEKLIIEMEKAGADIIEIGVPFSDPVAEGSIISRASERSLLMGTNLNKIFEMVKRVREKTQIPLLLMLYINSIFKFGKDEFFSLCKKNGIDGVIVPDLPFEERIEIEKEAEKEEIYIINLVAPTSKNRIEKIAKNSKGFLYCVSSLGVTGVRNSFNTNFNEMFDEIKKHSKTKTALGFGISTSEQVKQLKNYADGIIIGSAIVEIIEKYGKNCVLKVVDFIKNIRNSLDN